MTLGFQRVLAPRQPTWARVAKPREHGRRLKISYDDPTGKRRWKPTHKEAVKELRRLRAEVDAECGGPRTNRDTDQRFEDLVQLWTDVKPWRPTRPVS